MADIGHLFNDIELAQQIEFVIVVIKGLNLFLVKAIHILDMAEPVVDEAVLAVLHGGVDTAAIIVAADDDVPDLEYVHCVLDYRQAVEVGMYYHIGDITVHKDLARQHVDDLVGRYPTVGTADPQVFRPLLIGKFGEKLRVGLFDGGGPALVVVEKVFQHFHEYMPSWLVEKRYTELSVSCKDVLR